MTSRANTRAVASPDARSPPPESKGNPGAGLDPPPTGTSEWRLESALRLVPGLDSAQLRMS
jgi:hypothetical protein